MKLKTSLVQYVHIPAQMTIFTSITVQFQFSPHKYSKCNPPNAPVSKFFPITIAEAPKHSAQCRVVCVSTILYTHTQDIDGFRLLSKRITNKQLQ